MNGEAHGSLRYSGPNAISVDIEEYFQVAAFEPFIAKAQWDGIECRLASSMDRVLELFDDAQVKATFFTLGWVAERHPKLIRRVVDEGHEMASHGYDHTRVIEQTPEQFRADARKTKDILEDITGQAVNGYRAATYSIGSTNLWALEVLSETGHLYSSSIYPIRHDIYGMPNGPRRPFRLNANSVLELPITTLSFMGLNIPCGGGGYFRLFPYRVSAWALNRFLTEEQRPIVFYFHPWELDVEQPRVAGLGVKTRCRHYLNLSRTQDRLRRLLAEFNWHRVDRVFDIQSA